jgi:hypothetical protein
MLEQALRGARLLYAYTILIEAPLSSVFELTGEPASWGKDYDGRPLPNLAVSWEGPPYRPGSVIVLAPLRKDGTRTTVGAARLELLYYEKNVEISYRYLTGNQLIYRFVYEAVSPTRTEFTVNALVHPESTLLNSLAQRFYAGRRRKQAIRDHMRVKQAIEMRARSR